MDQMQERLNRALALLRNIKDLCTAPIEGRRLGPAWKLLSVVVNNALAYDFCVLSPEILLPYAKQLDEAIVDALPLFLGGITPDGSTIARLRLSRQHGGCDLPPAESRSLINGVPGPVYGAGAGHSTDRDVGGCFDASPHFRLGQGGAVCDASTSARRCLRGQLWNACGFYASRCI